MTTTKIRLTPVEYAVYGVLAAAKRETGPGGARRMCRIQDRLDNYDDEAIYSALKRLNELGWIRQCEEIFPGMVHFEVT